MSTAMVISRNPGKKGMVLSIPCVLDTITLRSELVKMNVRCDGVSVRSKVGSNGQTLITFFKIPEPAVCEQIARIAQKMVERGFVRNLRSR